MLQLISQTQPQPDVVPPVLKKKIPPPPPPISPQSTQAPNISKRPHLPQFQPRLSKRALKAQSNPGPGDARPRIKFKPRTLPPKGSQDLGVCGHFANGTYTSNVRPTDFTVPNPQGYLPAKPDDHLTVYPPATPPSIDPSTLFDSLTGMLSGLEGDLWKREATPGLATFDIQSLLYVIKIFQDFPNPRAMYRAESDYSKLLELKSGNISVLTEKECHGTFISPHLRIRFLMFSLHGGLDIVRETGKEFGSVSDFLASEGVNFSKPVPNIVKGFTSVHLKTKLGRARGAIPPDSYSLESPRLTLTTAGTLIEPSVILPKGHPLCDLIPSGVILFHGTHVTGTFSEVLRRWVQRFRGSVHFSLSKWDNYPSRALISGDFAKNVLKVSTATEVLGRPYIQLYDPSTPSESGLARGSRESIHYPIHECATSAPDWEWPGIKVGSQYVHRTPQSFVDTYRKTRPDALVNAYYDPDDLKKRLGADDVYFSGYVKDGSLNSLVDESAFCGVMVHTPLQQFAAALAIKVRQGLFNACAHPYLTSCARCGERDAASYMICYFLLLSITPHVASLANGSRVVLHDNYTTLSSVDTPPVSFSSEATLQDLVRSWLCGYGTCPSYVKGLCSIRNRGLTKSYDLSGSHPGIPCIFDDDLSPFERGLPRLSLDEGYLHSFDGPSSDDLDVVLDSLHALPFLFIKGHFVTGEYTPLGTGIAIAALAEIMGDGSCPYSLSMRCGIPHSYLSRGLLSCRDAEDAGNTILKYALSLVQWRTKFTTLTTGPGIHEGVFNYEYEAIEDGDYEADPYQELESEAKAAMEDFPFLERSFHIVKALTPTGPYSMLKMQDTQVELHAVYSHLLRSTGPIGFFVLLFCASAVKYPTESKLRLKHIPQACAYVQNFLKDALSQCYIESPPVSKVCELATSKSSGIDVFHAVSSGPVKIDYGDVTIDKPQSVSGKPKSVILGALGYQRLIDPAVALKAMGPVRALIFFRKDRMRPLRPVYGVPAGRLIATLGEKMGREAYMKGSRRQCNYMALVTAANVLARIAVAFHPGPSFTTDGSSYDQHEVWSSRIFAMLGTQITKNIRGSQMEAVFLEHHKDIAAGAASFASQYIEGDVIRVAPKGNLSGSMPTGDQNSLKNNTTVVFTADLLACFAAASQEDRMAGRWVPKEFGLKEAWNPEWGNEELTNMLTFNSAQSNVLPTLDPSNANVLGDDMIALLDPESPSDPERRRVFSQVVMKIGLLAYLFSGHTIKPSAVSLSMYCREFLKYTLIAMTIVQRARNFSKENSSEGSTLDTMLSAYRDATVANDRDQAYLIRSVATMLLSRTKVLGDVKQTYYVPSAIDCIANGFTMWPFPFHIIPISSLLDDEWALGASTSYTTAPEPTITVHKNDWNLGFSVSGDEIKAQGLHAACVGGRRDFIHPPIPWEGKKQLPDAFYKEFSSAASVEAFVSENIGATLVKKKGEALGIAAKILSPHTINRSASRSFMYDSLLIREPVGSQTACIKCSHGTLILYIGGRSVRSWKPFPISRVGPRCHNIILHVLGVTMKEPPHLLAHFKSVTVGLSKIGPMQLASIYLRYCMSSSGGWSTDSKLVDEALAAMNVLEKHRARMRAEADSIIYHIKAMNESVRYSQVSTTSYISQNVARVFCDAVPPRLGVSDNKHLAACKHVWLTIIQCALCYDIFKRYVSNRVMRDDGHYTFPPIDEYLSGERTIAKFPDLLVIPK